MKKFEKNCTKPGNSYYLVLFENRTKPGIVLGETVLSGDPLYIFVNNVQKGNLIRFCRVLNQTLFEV